MTKTRALLVASAVCVAWSAFAQAPNGPAPEGQTAGARNGGYGVVKSPPDTIAIGIPGVIAAGTPIHLVKDMFQSVEGAIAMPDGSLLVTEQDAGDGRLNKIDKDDHVSVFAENTNRTIGLGYDPKGRLIGAQSRIPRVAVIAPTREILADQFEGGPLVFVDDLVIDKKGGIYFVDEHVARFRPIPPNQTTAVIFYIRPDGKLVKASEEDPSPNGIILSTDEKTLYATNGPTIVAWDVQPDGSLKNYRKYATLEGRNADSICIDGAGRIYVSTATGVQVVGTDGKVLGTIPTPLTPQSVAFAGPDKKTLYIAGRGAVYKAQMIAQGYLGRAK